MRHTSSYARYNTWDCALPSTTKGFTTEKMKTLMNIQLEFKKKDTTQSLMHTLPSGSFNPAFSTMLGIEAGSPFTTSCLGTSTCPGCNCIYHQIYFGDISNLHSQT